MDCHGRHEREPDIVLVAAVIWMASLFVRMLTPTGKRSAGRELKNSEKLQKMDPYEFEKYVAEIYRRQNYKNVQVTVKSGDYGADILATDPSGRKVCIQCKRYQNKVGVEAVQQINSARGYYRCQRAIVVSTSDFTKQAKSLAEKNGVELYKVTE